MTEQQRKKKDREIFKMLEKHGAFSAKGARKFFCGELLNWGATREVFVLKQDSDYVVKIQHKDGLDNAWEYLIWNEIKYCTTIRHWFAPVIGINMTATVLVQRRAIFPRHREYPKYVPSFFCDLKLQNFGLIDGHLACVDYGCLHVSKIMDDKKLRYAKWWNVDKLKKKYKGRVPGKVIKKCA